MDLTKVRTVAIKYERALQETESKELGRACLEDMKRRKQLGRDMGIWEKKRKDYYTGKGYAEEEIERLRQQGWNIEEMMMEKDVEIQKQEDFNRIENGRYSTGYLRVVGRPQYLTRLKTEDMRTVARFRCGNEERGNRYWEEIESRRCRICGVEEENIEHWLKRCDGLREEEREREEILNGDGKGLKWMKLVLKEVRRS